MQTVASSNRVTPTSLESFIVRLYRNTNRDGFVKAFSDQPEQFTQGMFPLKTVMKELQLRKTHIIPRFHQEVQQSLGRRKADVVELHVPLTPKMKDIHTAIYQCMSGTLNELKRSNSTLDLDDFTVQNAYFRSFDAIVRRQLDPVWHKVGYRTKQLVADLGTLRRLMNYLLTFDPITFLVYLETIFSSDTKGGAGGITSNQEKSDWLYTDAAHIMITTARARCYTVDPKKKTAPPSPINEADDDAQWDILDDVNAANAASNSTAIPMLKRSKFAPEGMTPVLEEPGKWRALAEVLLEIEEQIVHKPLRFNEPGSNYVLVMVSDSQTAELIQKLLSSIHLSPPDSPGRRYLERRLKDYFYWRRDLFKAGHDSNSAPSKGKEKETVVNEALLKKDQERAAAKAARRRVRGGGSVNVVVDSERKKVVDQSETVPGEAGINIEELEKFLEAQPLNVLEDEEITYVGERMDVDAWNSTDDDYFGLLEPEQVVVVRTYGDDGDDQILSELRPRYIVMYDPNQDFVRRIEVYRSSNPGLAVRVYFMLYHTTSEEHKYLAGQRREKDAFERLIKERASMLIPIYDNPSVIKDSDSALTAISTRIGGGQRTLQQDPPRVIVDMREFRSSLPNLIDKARMQVIPATLTVGDYVLTPNICVERKSVPDLIQSFISGRLYTQCELMSVHYKNPILLIEFEESKSFSLQTIAETKTGPKKRQNEKQANTPATSGSSTDLQSQSKLQNKLVLLTLAFPRLRIIWSSSPHSSADIFKDLKANSTEPDVLRAITIGAEEDGDANPGEINTLAEDLLRALPGIGAKNLRYVTSRVESVAALCEMSLKEIQDLLGVEPGKRCYDFIHHNSKK
ncbi:hypothetical protein FRC02_011596 [Tulasnella sp. 418]|nr:hypothetical protein FRC02_011596 [Tulasnella sp. 418]